MLVRGAAQLARRFAGQRIHFQVDIPAVGSHRICRVVVARVFHDWSLPRFINTDPTATSAIPSAEKAIDVQAPFPFAVGTTGSGGRLYTSGLSSSKKNAFRPSVPGWFSLSTP